MSRNITNQNSEGFRESETELQNIPSSSAREIHWVSRCSRNTPRSKWSGSTPSPSIREWFRGQVLENYSECRSSGHLAQKLGVSSERQKIIFKI